MTVRERISHHHVLLRILDTLEGPGYMDSHLSDEGSLNLSTPKSLFKFPLVLPSVVHPSYLFGDPLSIKRPASRPKRLFESSSRALFGDTVLLRAGVNDFLRWKEPELDTLLPVNEEGDEVDTERNDDEEEEGVWQPGSMITSLQG